MRRSLTVVTWPDVAATRRGAGGRVPAVELRQLRYFLAVADERRFASAARRLHISAPSLSQQVRALEHELQVTLFDRSSAGANLTPAGQVLAHRARVIMVDLDRAREEVRFAERSSRHQITVRICTMAERVLDGPLHHLGVDIPGAEVVVTSSPGDDAVEAVRQARADAAVVWRRPYEHRDLDGVVLGSVAFGIVLPEGHPLADRPQVPVSALSSETVVMFPLAPFSGIWQRVLDHLLPGGARSGQVLIEPDLINSPEAMVRAVAAGSVVTPGILGVADGMGVSGVVVRPLDPPLYVDLEAVWRRPAGPGVRRLVEFLLRSAENPGTLFFPRPSDEARS